MRQESAQKLSTDVRALIESLYRSLREEKAKVAELRAKLAAKDELNLVITEKDTQIESLKKENALLQQSLTDCIAQCMESPAFSQEKQNLNSDSEMSIYLLLPILLQSTWKH
ncbi:hypothetical protein TYRP_010481 [Tyrophagus putrescentiae]|nr:hypothetical protein TYRP_010481 [Tyrophagus putrescentiae]